MNWKGDKYEETKSLNSTEIAKRVRTDIKQAVASGKLPKGIKISVRTEYYSMGSSINVVVRGLPGIGALINPERVIFEAENPLQLCQLDRYTPSAQKTLDTLKDLVNSYNYDASDIQTDYFDRGFSEHIGFDHDLETADRTETLRLYEEARTSGQLEAARCIEQLFVQARFAAKSRTTKNVKEMMAGSLQNAINHGEALMSRYEQNDNYRQANILSDRIAHLKIISKAICLDRE